MSSGRKPRPYVVVRTPVGDPDRVEWIYSRHTAPVAVGGHVHGPGGAGDGLALDGRLTFIGFR